MGAVAEAVQVVSPDKQAKTERSSKAQEEQIKKLVGVLHDKPFPIFRNTLEQLSQFENKPNVSIPKLADILRTDPCFSHHIFLAANKGLIKNKKPPAINLNHAILVLGIPRIVTIGKNLPIITDLQDPRIKSKIYQVLSRSYHAGVQARELMSVHDSSASSTAFVTAQLCRLYEIGLWLYSPEEMSALIKSGKQTSSPEHYSIFDAIGKFLFDQWKYADLVSNSLNPASDSVRLVQITAFANRLAQVSERGWYHNSMEVLIEQSANQFGYRLDDFYRLVHRNAVIAARESCFYPVKPAACQLISTTRTENPATKTSMPVPKKQQSRQVKTTLQKTLSTTPKRKEQGADPVKNELLSALDTLKAMGNKKRPAHEILTFSFKLLQRVSDGRPLVFFLLDKNRTFLKSRFTVNLGQQKKSIAIPVKQQNIFSLLMKKPQVILVNEKNRKRYSDLLPEVSLLNIKQQDFAARSLFVHNKPVGLFYLEGTLKKPLSAECYQHFVYICKKTAETLEEVK